ncbi:MAG: diaminopimelate epimerase [Flavobacteriales bacterium]|nr:diaminopimelate epimerase [Flavobacteriales bacterium]MCB9447857.1 diaminopimelate epimerase [Flavobacteriales bacterium]
MNLKFEKYHGTGNDFVVIDDRSHSFPTDDYALVARLCERHKGIGADGLMLLRKREGFDFEMVYYNSDGNPGSMCGNGGRCITAFAVRLGIVSHQARFMAYDGPHEAYVKPVTGQPGLHNVKLQMGDVKSVEMVGQDFFLDTGSPHLVSWRKNLQNLNVKQEGSAIRYNDRFREKGTNVNFVDWEDGRLLVRTYERGVEDETLCCGTGVTASAVCYAHINGIGNGIIPVTMPGGDVSVHLKVAADGTYTDVWLEGIATHVFSGEMVL